ncbi:hypothetical protein HJFPF1_01838 [Paramyrothecium foliicola]|nr:hypothetical protein HJFPF1_01838 [Paramyrothecium foliicola]
MSTHFSMASNRLEGRTDLINIYDAEDLPRSPRLEAIQREVSVLVPFDTHRHKDRHLSTGPDDIDVDGPNARWSIQVGAAGFMPQDLRTGVLLFMPKIFMSL